MRLCIPGVRVLTAFLASTDFKLLLPLQYHRAALLLAPLVTKLIGECVVARFGLGVADGGGQRSSDALVAQVRSALNECDADASKLDTVLQALRVLS